jgi:hypothetical protein
MKWLVCFLACFPILLWHTFSSAGNKTDMDKVYSDESHCLVAPEIRGNKDNPNSCYCRDGVNTIELAPYRCFARELVYYSSQRHG